jgi:phosphatidate cytidylyltransferase
MLKHRLLFGTLMTVVFTGIVLLDGWIDGSITASPADDRAVKATLAAFLVALVMGLGSLEFAKLASFKNMVVMPIASTFGAIVLSTSWYWLQPVPDGRRLPLLVVILAGLFLAVLLEQYFRHVTEDVLPNCGASCMALAYLGVIGAFFLILRIDIGLWHALMVIAAVKCSDIGAYTFGKLLGKHRFSPRISPGKTWEGFLGAVVFAVAVSLAFASILRIMSVGLAVLFGVCLASVGQMGDLAESMMKRDARQKDSSSRVPGFGGILDVIDSPLMAAPFAYVFFKLIG